MSSRGPRPGEAVKDVRVDDGTLSVDLMDGRTIVVPLYWFPRLSNATPEQRSHRSWVVAGGGSGIHWPDVDEDLSVEGLLLGEPVAAGKPPP